MLECVCVDAFIISLQVNPSLLRLHILPEVMSSSFLVCGLCSYCVIYIRVVVRCLPSCRGLKLCITPECNLSNHEDIQQCASDNHVNSVLNCQMFQSPVGCYLFELVNVADDANFLGANARYSRWALSLITPCHVAMIYSFGLVAVTPAHYCCML